MGYRFESQILDASAPAFESATHCVTGPLQRLGYVNLIQLYNENADRLPLNINELDAGDPLASDRSTLTALNAIHRVAEARRKRLGELEPVKETRDAVRFLLIDPVVVEVIDAASKAQQR